MGKKRAGVGGCWVGDTEEGEGEGEGEVGLGAERTRKKKRKKGRGMVEGLEEGLEDGRDVEGGTDEGGMESRGVVQWEGVLEWQKLLPDTRRPVCVEVGCGMGEWVVGRALEEEEESYWVAMEQRFDRAHTTFVRANIAGAPPAV